MEMKFESHQLILREIIKFVRVNGIDKIEFTR